VRNIININVIAQFKTTSQGLKYCRKKDIEGKITYKFITQEQYDLILDELKGAHNVQKNT